MRISEIMTEAIFTKLTGRDGLSVIVWKNPSHGEFARVAAAADPSDGTRCILTESDMYLWQSNSVLHNDFIHQTGVSGIKVLLHPDKIAVNLEAVAAPEDIPWVFADQNIDALDNDQRQALIENWLRRNSRLSRAYAANFAIHWYM